MQKQVKRSFCLNKIISLFCQLINSIHTVFSKLRIFDTISFSNQLSLKRFYFKLLASNLLLLVLLVVSYIGYEYIEWQKNIKTETKSLKALININVANYTSIIELIEKQIHSKGTSDLDSLNIQKYNNLFSFDKNYIPLVNIHFVVKDKNSNKNSFKQKGKNTFAILPDNEFLYSIADHKTSTYLIEPQHDLIFITKAIQHSKETIFIVLKTRIRDYSFTCSIVVIFVIEGLFFKNW